MALKSYIIACIFFFHFVLRVIKTKLHIFLWSSLMWGKLGKMRHAYYISILNRNASILLNSFILINVNCSTVINQKCLSVIKGSFFGSIWSVFKICEVIASLVNKDLPTMELKVGTKSCKYLQNNLYNHTIYLRATKLLFLHYFLTFYLIIVEIWSWMGNFPPQMTCCTKNYLVLI